MFTACSCAMSVRVSLVRLHTKYVTLNVSFVRYLFAFVFVSTHFLFPEINYCEWYADVSEHLPLASSLCFFSFTRCSRLRLSVPALVLMPLMLLL